jgi:hypothetical protein
MYVFGTAQALTAISTGSIVEPYYYRRMFYLAKSGQIIELDVTQSPG